MNSSVIGVLQAALEQQERGVDILRRKLAQDAKGLAAGHDSLGRAEVELAELRAGLAKATADATRT